MRFRPNPFINAGSMADIAFLLLLFFLVATSIENPKGIQVLLPIFYPDRPIPIDENRVLSIKINAVNHIIVESKSCILDNISNLVINFVNERLAMNDQPIVSILTDTSAVYETYIAVYNEIKSAFTKLRKDQSINDYGRKYDLLSKKEGAAIIDKIPMIISEADYC